MIKEYICDKCNKVINNGTSINKEVYKCKFCNKYFCSICFENHICKIEDTLDIAVKNGVIGPKAAKKRKKNY